MFFTPEGRFSNFDNDKLYRNHNVCHIRFNFIYFSTCARGMKWDTLDKGWRLMSTAFSSAFVFREIFQRDFKIDSL